jgi:UDP-glucose 4-epimerase
MRCLVLGAGGFIGSHLVGQLLAAGHRVRCFDLPEVLNSARVALGSSSVELLPGNFCSESDLAQALEGCDVCYHLVSTTLPKSSNLDPIFDIESNLIGTVQLLQAAVKTRVKRMVFVSSGGTVYGAPSVVPITENHPVNPICSYGITKLAIEKYLEMFRILHGLDYCVLRLANPYGERQRTHSSQGAVAVFLGKAMRGECIEVWGDGSVIRDYLHVEDVCRALTMALDVNTGKHRVYNIGSGAGLSLRQVLGTISLTLGRDLDVKYTESRDFDVPVSVLSTERASQTMGWVPRISFEVGIERFFRWLSEDNFRLS